MRNAYLLPIRSKDCASDDSNQVIFKDGLICLPEYRDSKIWIVFCNENTVIEISSFSLNITFSWYYWQISSSAEEAIEMFSWPSLHERIPDVGIELGAACMPSGHATDRATAPGIGTEVSWYVISYRTACIVIRIILDDGRIVPFLLDKAKNYYRIYSYNTVRGRCNSIVLIMTYWANIPNFQCLEANWYAICTPFSHEKVGGAFIRTDVTEIRICHLNCWTHEHRKHRVISYYLCVHFR